MPGKKLLTQERLCEVLQYSPTSGIFIWRIKISNRIKAGNVAGAHEKDGYVRIGIDNKRYRAHRLAFLYVCGYLPEQEVDHLNGIRNDNRWSNLRHVSRFCNAQNCQLSTNSTSGFIGVSWDKNVKKWLSHIGIHREFIRIGYYDTAEEAALVRCHFEDENSDWTCNHLAVNRVKLRSLGYEI